jgi:serine/threonine protein kinase
VLPSGVMDDPLLGTEIARYRLERVLGEGGMGRVYLGVQQAIGARVAIKVLSEECTRNAELLDRFFAEAKAVNLIRHENIISVLDLSTLPDGRPFIIMEFIEGQTLAHHVRRSFAPIGGVAQVIGEVLSGLAAAHAIGIVHRDMKPDNVLVTVEGHAKVLDFGIAKLAPGLRADVSPRTKTGALLGTPAYMAPEQISGAQNVDARTDIYAAGIVLYEAVTGAVPFSGATLFDVMRAHLEDAPQPPRQRRGDIPPALEEVILQALAKDPAHRFQSATAMAQALSHATATLPPEQWRPLSTRGGPRISAAGLGSPSQAVAYPTPHAPTERQSPPSHMTALGHASDQQQAPGAYRSTAVAPKTESRSKRTGLIVGLFAAAAIGTGIVLVATSGGAKNDRVATAEPAGSGGSATAPVATAAPASTTASPPPTSPSTTTASPEPREASSAPESTPASTTTGKQKVATAAGGKVTSAPAQRAAPPATDPSVHIGDNVHIGPGVVIGNNPPTTAPNTPTTTTAPASRSSVTQAADYNPKRFDPVAYLPKALALAQQLMPDAKLTSFEFDPVFADGHVDLTMDGRDREYLFRSPSKSARPPDVPRNIPVERACIVHVEVGAREVVATIRKSEDCNAKLVRTPTCKFAGVWKQAIANGTPTDVVARVGWLFDEKWFFDVDLEGKGGGVSTFVDRCP